jgi:lipoic acid synthetase
MGIVVPRGQKNITKPSWLKVKAPGSPEYLQTREIVKRRKLNTVCEEAHCPNIGECWSHKTATFMIMGEYCTRRCHFCSVKDGTPENLQPLDQFEPFQVAMATKELGLKHVVITSVDRDDQPDNGASHFAMTVRAIRFHSPECKIELLIPDLQGKRNDLQVIVEAGIDILNHNVETVPRLYRKVRPGAEYERSLSILEWAKQINPQVKTKSGIMVGLGEKSEEVYQLMDDLREANVDIMTIGQYLRPTEKQLPVKEYITPEEFDLYREEGLKRGFAFVESGPLVRSSYHAWKHTTAI